MLALAGCGEGVEVDNGAATVDPQVTVDTLPEAGVPPGAPPPAAAGLALEGEGLRIFLTESGAARPISFGMSVVDAVRLVETVLGEPPYEQGVSPDCGDAYAAWSQGLTLRFARERFVGWSLTGDSTSLTTPTGIGIGSTREDVEAAHVVDITETSLGFEFTVGALAGLLDSPAEHGRVVALWAGEVCLAR